jgi:hypothetical protein
MNTQVFFIMLVLLSFTLAYPQSAGNTLFCRGAYAGGGICLTKRATPEQRAEPMFSKIIHSIILLPSLANGLRARHSLENPSQSRPNISSHPSVLLEKRGLSAKRLSSSALVDSEATIPPEAPVLKIPPTEDGGNQGQKRNRVRSAEQRIKHAEDERNRNARKMKELQENPTDLAAWKEKIRLKNARHRKKAAGKKAKEDKAGKLDKEEKEEKAKSDKNPDVASERRLRYAVCILGKKGTDPTTLAELETKEKKLLEVRQRLDAFRDAKRKELDAASEIKAAASNSKKSPKKTGKELWKVAKAKSDKNPDFASERSLREAVCRLRKKGTDPTTLAELEKKLLEVRQRLEAERKAAALDANPLYAKESNLRSAVSKLRKKGTDPTALAELEKKLVDVRQRLKAEKEAKSEALNAAVPDANPLYAKERNLRSAVSKLKKKGMDPTTLAELEKKEKQLVDVRQRLKAEKEAKREALDAADPDKRAV